MQGGNGKGIPRFPAAFQVFAAWTQQHHPGTSGCLDKASYGDVAQWWTLFVIGIAVKLDPRLMQSFPAVAMLMRWLGGLGGGQSFMLKLRGRTACRACRHSLASTVLNIPSGGQRCTA